MKINKRTIKKIFFIIIAVILLLSMYLNTYLVLKYNVLPFKFLIIYFILVGLIPILLILGTVFTKIRTSIKGVLLGIEILYIIILSVVFFYLNNTFNFLDDFTSGFEYETKNYYVLTLNDSEYKEINDLENKTIGYAEGLDQSVLHALEELDEKVTIGHKTFDGYTTLFDKFNNKELDSILMIQSYYDLLTEADETIKETTKILYKFSIKEKVNEITKDVDVTKETFNVYLSGIDSYGGVAEKTRSDVNIVMSINPKTNKILMINIPRDYYVEFDGLNKKDKLTHAGMYGVETSTKTIENLLDIEINYYVKVSYNALIKLVDALGGVDVYSKYDFVSVDIYHHFKKGYNHVNGDQALDFVRTRKAFLGGDRVRGENQQAMIEAVIKKAASADILLKYDDILKSLEGSFATNISTSKIMSLVNIQLNSMPKWKIESISLDGYDAYEYSAYYGQELYVMKPNEETITLAKEQLNAIN